MQYPIQEWEAFQVECNNNPNPAFYFSLTPELKKILKENNDWIQIKITGTQSPYDDHVFLGKVSTSANMPNNRPNFYEVEGLYVFSLDTKWLEYPKTNGFFEVVDGVLVNYTDKPTNTLVNTILKKDVFPINKQEVENYSKEKLYNWVLILVIIVVSIIIIKQLVSRRL
jgi:hypothetical protein